MENKHLQYTIILLNEHLPWHISLNIFSNILTDLKLAWKHLLSKINKTYIWQSLEKSAHSKKHYK